ncbi:hotdog fold thioesterase [Psychroflexus sp. CAK57W]|uniref:PaaI family thioesterase n=1 Tax=Psychroflexus curvus TaxID=2873595 RepID=UPI001CC990C1|nr:hotdog fold thioesterase [Psychroflexus curvus]MBZ9785889.1 hotdog fold thioesterase [Psychroflexus curvus]
MKNNSGTHKQKDSETIPEKMLSQDPFSTWLGIEILEVSLGKCKVGLKIRPEMLNSMQKAHGGISYALADTAFGFAANTYGKYAVSIETSINHIEALHVDDYITAESKVEVTKNRLGFHYVEVKKGEEIVALFKGVVFRTSKEWELNDN